MSILKMKIPLERHEEATFMRLIKGFPIKVRKMNGLGNASWPDRLVLLPNGRIIWIELKRKKVGKLSKGQEILFEEMRGMGHEVFVFDDGELAANSVKLALLTPFTGR